MPTVKFILEAADLEKIANIVEPLDRSVLDGMLYFHTQARTAEEKSRFHSTLNLKNGVVWRLETDPAVDFTPPAGLETAVQAFHYADRWFEECKLREQLEQRVQELEQQLSEQMS